MRAATSGVMMQGAATAISLAFIFDPAARVPANLSEGAASMVTRSSSSDTSTCSITIAVSNPSGMATPVFANSQSTPRTHELVSGTAPGSRSAKSSHLTAIESSAHVSAEGTSLLQVMSRDRTRPYASSRATRSGRILPDDAESASVISATASWRDSSTCSEWSLITFSKIDVMFAVQSCSAAWPMPPAPIVLRRGQHRKSRLRPIWEARP